MAGAAAASRCIFCQIAGKSSSTTLLHTDEKVVAFQDIKPAALRHYLVIPVDHIPTVNDLQRRPDDYLLVSHMLEVGKALIQRDAPQSHQYRFGFHQPPFNSVNHLHLHCFALPYTPSLLGSWSTIRNAQCYIATIGTPTLTSISVDHEDRNNSFGRVYTQQATEGMTLSSVHGWEYFKEPELYQNLSTGNRSKRKWRPTANAWSYQILKT